MVKLEKDIEDRFFDLITNQEDNPCSNSFAIYQKLVYFRYDEVIKNTFPQFCKLVDKQDLENSILEFMKNPPSTPFIWKIAKKYISFIKKNKLFNNEHYLYELLYFEWIEVEISMKEYKNKKTPKFSWNNSYKLSSNARIKRFKYDIVNRRYKENREHFLIFYYDFSKDEVLVREIHQLIYELIKSLDNKKTVNKILEKLCKKNDIDFNEAKIILEEPLQDLFSKNIFK